jgi:hypothetical protein
MSGRGECERFRSGRGSRESARGATWMLRLTCRAVDLRGRKKKEKKASVAACCSSVARLATRLE